MIDTAPSWAVVLVPVAVAALALVAASLDAALQASAAGRRLDATELGKTAAPTLPGDSMLLNSGVRARAGGRCL